jgi:hypothetical protein
VKGISRGLFEVLFLKYWPAVFPESLKKTENNFGKDNQFQDKNLNVRHPTYEAHLVITHCTTMLRNLMEMLRYKVKCRMEHIYKNGWKRHEYFSVDTNYWDWDFVAVDWFAYPVIKHMIEINSFLFFLWSLHNYKIDIDMINILLDESK